MTLMYLILKKCFCRLEGALSLKKKGDRPNTKSEIHVNGQDMDDHNDSHLKNISFI